MGHFGAVGEIGVAAGKPRDSDCVICMQAIGCDCVEVPTCGHAFHSECIKEWLAHRPVCPICRHDLAKEDEETESDCSATTSRERSPLPSPTAAASDQRDAAPLRRSFVA